MPSNAYSEADADDGRGTEGDVMGTERDIDFEEEKDEQRPPELGDSLPPASAL